MTGLQQDFENINEERVKLLDEIDKMKKELNLVVYGQFYKGIIGK